jgi:capsular polysaccharide export protein
MLQGPIGPFFRRLAKQIKASGGHVQKVNFNGGDRLFYPTGAHDWRGPMHEWPAYLASLLDTQKIDIVLLFGDCRPIHRSAREVALQRDVTVGVFEEGYIRPNFITFEQFGVNAYSSLPRTAQFYRAIAPPPRTRERQIRNTFRRVAMWAILYYLASAILQARFRKYCHHRPLTLLEAGPWLRSGWRKLGCAWQERGTLQQLRGPLSDRFYLVLLQTARDAQVINHSAFASVEAFIRAAAMSFAGHAPEDMTLVFKHHPLDRGYSDYRMLISRLMEELGLRGRVLYIHDQHLPTLLEHARGAVVINSTSGLSALVHGIPVKTCGTAVYDMEGLTFRGSLNSFWDHADSQRPDMNLLERFCGYMIEHTQINASLYTGTLKWGLCDSMKSLDSHRTRSRLHSTSEPESQLAATLLGA